MALHKGAFNICLLALALLCQDVLATHHHHHGHHNAQNTPVQGSAPQASLKQQKDLHATIAAAMKQKAGKQEQTAEVMQHDNDLDLQTMAEQPAMKHHAGKQEQKAETMQQDDEMTASKMASPAKKTSSNMKTTEAKDEQDTPVASAQSSNSASESAQDTQTSEAEDEQDKPVASAKSSNSASDSAQDTQTSEAEDEEEKPVGSAQSSNSASDSAQDTLADGATKNSGSSPVSASGNEASQGGSGTDNGSKMPKKMGSTRRVHQRLRVSKKVTHKSASKGSSIDLSPLMEASHPCSTVKHNCSVHAMCNATGNSYTCTCPEGFTGDGTTCSCPSNYFAVSSKCRGSTSSICFAHQLHCNGQADCLDGEDERNCPKQLAVGAAAFSAAEGLYVANAVLLISAVVTLFA